MEKDYSLNVKAQGPKGDKGDKGDVGPQGPKGDPGATGSQGPTGPKGDTGSQGPVGPTGPQGVAGPTGATGPRGPQGIQGVQGQHGLSIWANKYSRGGNMKGSYWSDLYGTAPGNGPQVGDITVQPDGSYYQVTAVSNSNSGSNGGGTFDIGTKIGSLQGPQGIQGPVGPKGDVGSTGPQGPKGDKGDTGSQGPIGPTGPKGETGVAGAQGVAGPAGKDGADGKTPYFHVAYANSADGKDGFYVGGGINIITGTGRDLQTAPDSSNKMSGGQIYRFTSDELNSLAGNLVTARAFIHNTTSHTVNLVIWTDSSNFSVGNGIPAGTDGYSTVTAYNISPKAANGDISIRAYTENNVAISGVQYKELKLEKGSVATPWSPAPSESHPTYMGTYTDYTQAASLDPTAYQWSLIKGDRGLSIWFNKNAYGGNLQGKWWSDLYNTRVGFGPQVGDLVIQSNGMITQVTRVNVSGDTSQGGGTFDIGAVIGNMQGPQGPKGNTGATGSQGPQGIQGIRGKDGETWQPYINADGYWHIKKLAGEPDGISISSQNIKQLEDYIDNQIFNQILNGKW